MRTPLSILASSNYAPLGDFKGFAFSTEAGLSMLILGSVIGAGIAFSIYAISVISIPMLMDRSTDLFTAVARSVAVVRANPGPLLLWAWLIAILTAAGVATLLIGLAIVFPLLGHATWHAYKDIAGDEAM